MDVPRIYEIYRAMDSPLDSNYITANSDKGTDFGVIFTADYEIWPSQYRKVDSFGSIIDQIITTDDTMESDLLRDIIGVSSLKKTSGEYMQPMFRIVPGFLNETQKLHGNDALDSGSGNSIVMGDDIRGFSGIDVTEIREIQDARGSIDALVGDISDQLATLEVDTELYRTAGIKDMLKVPRLTIACDNITTNGMGSVLATGDSLTFIWRTQLG
eukprot:3306882-Ditylum_brightwellii.AAC.1